MWRRQFAKADLEKRLTAFVTVIADLTKRSPSAECILCLSIQQQQLVAARPSNRLPLQPAVSSSVRARHRLSAHSSQELTIASQPSHQQQPRHCMGSSISAP